MVTVVNSPNPAPRDTTVIDRGDSGTGWAVAVIILIAIIAFGGYYWLHAKKAAAPADTGGSANVNIQLPAGDSGSQDTSGSQTAPAY